MHPLPYFGYSSHLPQVEQFNATAERMHTGDQFSTGLLTIEAPQISLLAMFWSLGTLREHLKITQRFSDITQRKHSENTHSPHFRSVPSSTGSHFCGCCCTTKLTDRLGSTNLSKQKPGVLVGAAVAPDNTNST